MVLLRYFRAFLLCLIVAGAQTSETTKLNEIKSNSKTADDSAVKAASGVIVAIKELKPKERDDSLEASSSTPNQKRQNTPSSGKFGQRSSNAKEEVKTEASHRGERFLPDPKVPHAQINPQLQNPGSGHITFRNAAPQEPFPVAARQEQRREGTRNKASGVKRVGYGDVRNSADAARLQINSQEYDASLVVQRPNIHRVQQSQPRQAKAQDFDVSYDERDDECSRSKSRSVSEEDVTDDRYPRQSRFSHRIQSPDGHRQHQEYADDYSYRPQSSDESRSFDSRERSEEDYQLNGKERRQFDREQRHNSRDPREGRRQSKNLPRHPDQQSYEQTSEGSGESVSEHKESDSVSKTMSVSKSYSEPRKAQKVIVYGKADSSQRGHAIFRPMSTPNEEQPPYEEHRTHQQVNAPASQNHAPRGYVRGNRQGPENPPRKALRQPGHYQTSHEHSGPPHYERSPSQTHYSNDNSRELRDHHASRHHQQHPVQDQQHPLPQQHHTHPNEQRHYHAHPHEQRQHHTHPHEPRQHHTHSHEQRQHNTHPHEQGQHHDHPHEPRQPHDHSHEPRQPHDHSHEPRQHQAHPHEPRQHHARPNEPSQHHAHPHEQSQNYHQSRAQDAGHYVDHQVPTGSQNQRQDFGQQQQQYGQPSIPAQQLRENKKQKVTPIYQSYDSRYQPSAADTGAYGRNSPAPGYKRDHVAHATSRHPGKGPAAQTHQNIEQAKPLPQGDSDGAYYPAQDSEIRQHISSIHASPRLPENAHDPRAQVSVSYSESRYKNGKLEQLRFAPGKPSHFDQFQRHSEFFKEPLYEFGKTPVSDYFEKPVHNPIVIPEKSQGPRLEFEYTQKGKIQDDKFPSSEFNSNQGAGYGYQMGPQAEHYQHLRDDYGVPPKSKDESRDGVLSFLKDHTDISDKAKIIVAEPVPGNPGVLVADGKRAIVAGNMRGRGSPHSHSASGESEYADQPQGVNKPLLENPGHERNFGITQNIPGSFSALVNTDPKFLRRLPELMYSGRDPSIGSPDSGTYFSNSAESTSKEIEGRNNYESKSAAPPSADLKSYDTGHGIIQDHGDGVRSVMYHIRPKNNHGLPAIPEESRTSEEKHKHPSALPESENSEKLQFAKSATVIKTVKADNPPNKTDQKTETSTK